MQMYLRMAAIAAALALAGCAVPDVDTLSKPDFQIFAPKATSAMRDTSLRPVAPEDLVDAQGRCGVAAVAAGAEGSEQVPAPVPASVPMIPSGVAIDMSECDVVKRAGQAEKIDLGTNERGERTATLTYTQGPRPGIYHFTAGRLTSMERAPEPATPARPTRPAKKPATARRAT